MLQRLGGIWAVFIGAVMLTIQWHLGPQASVLLVFCAVGSVAFGSSLILLDGKEKPRERL